MKSLWNDSEAELFAGDLGQRVYSSRLLGRDPALVQHGGGNTSVKISETNLFGEDEAVLYVKGSGADLEFIEHHGFAPVRLAPLQRLATLAALSDPEMVGQLRSHTTRADAPAPSVEAILHAVLPHKYVDHTHADAVLIYGYDSGNHQFSLAEAIGIDRLGAIDHHRLRRGHEQLGIIGHLDERAAEIPPANHLVVGTGEHPPIGAEGIEIGHGSPR